ELRAAEIDSRPRDRRQVQAGRVLVPSPEMQSEALPAGRLIRKVDEEDLIEAALAEQLRRQPLHVVRRGHRKHRRLPLLQPGEERAEDALRDAAILAAAVVGARLLDLVDEEHARRTARRAVASAPD